MSDPFLTRPQYHALLKTFTPLCPGCLDLHPSIFDWRAVPWASLYPKLDARKIVLGAYNRCASCEVITAAFQSAGLDLRTIDEAQSISLFSIKQNKNGGLLASTRASDNGRLVSVELLTVPDQSFSPWSIIHPRPLRSGSTASTESFQVVRQWIRTCEVSHEQCPGPGTGALPTRVLNLGDSNDSIKLIETRGASGTYICLSHCWGQSPTILCTEENYMSFRDNIPWAVLPPLFRDTVEVCRMLEVRYLWIDKLCIIQHNLDDWAREGSRMAQIFTKSFLTIAAVMSKNDMDPLFSRSEGLSTSQGSHTGRTQDGSCYTIHFRSPIDYHPAEFEFPNYEMYPLMTRAWVYQERLLAPRTLYFGEELSWRCRETSACECSGSSHLKEPSLTVPSSRSLEELRLQWQYMVESFTRLELTFEDDRLPAFSGLAQQYQLFLKTDYLAGLWRDDLIAGLMWFARPDYSIAARPYPTSRPQNWRAPSWSWASVEGPVLFSKEWYFSAAERHSEDNGWIVGTSQITWLAEVISACCSASSLDPMGQIAEGQLVMKGTGRSACLKHKEDCDGPNTRHYMVKERSMDSVRVRSNFSVDGHQVNVDYDLIQHGLMLPNSGINIYVFCLAGMTRLQRTFHRDREEYSERAVYRTWNLLLRCVNGRDFERIGFVDIDYKSNDHARKDMHDCTITIV